MRSTNSGSASVWSDTSENSPFISFALLPAFGHVYPVMPLAEAVRATGARVQVAVGKPFQGNLPLPTVLGTDVDPRVTPVPEVTREQFPAVAEDMRNRWVPAYFGVAHALPAVAALRRAWRDDRPDLVVYDPANPAAAVVADELSIPSVLFSVFHYFPSMLDLPAVTRRALDCPEVDPWEPLEQATRLCPYIDPVPAALQVGPIADHPEVLPIRSVPWEDPLTPPVRLPGRAPSGAPARPLIYVTLGTVVATPGLLREVILEAARIGDVIASTGPSNDRDQLGDLPENITVHRFVPTRAVMGTADLVVHHGGLRTTGACAPRWPRRPTAFPNCFCPRLATSSRTHKPFPAWESAARWSVRALVGPRAGRSARWSVRALVGPRADGAICDALATLHADPDTKDAARAVAHGIATTPGPDRIAEELVSRAAGREQGVVWRHHVFTS